MNKKDELETEEETEDTHGFWIDPQRSYYFYPYYCSNSHELDYGCYRKMPVYAKG